MVQYGGFQAKSVESSQRWQEANQKDDSEGKHTYFWLDEGRMVDISQQFVLVREICFISIIVLRLYNFFLKN